MIPTTRLSFLRRAIDDADARAFVHVGDRFDDTMRYLTRFSGPDRPYAFVHVPADSQEPAGGGGRAILCAPRLFREQAEREFVTAHVTVDAVDRSVRSHAAGEPAGVRAVEALDAVGVTTGSVLVPQHIPHDAAVYLQQAGYELQSTSAVAEQRAVKTDMELDRLQIVQTAATAGMARAETVLAESTEINDELRWDGDRLTTGRLRREINAELAARGVRDAGNTVIGAGKSAADLHFTGDAAIDPGETVLIDISPRGPHGYYGDLTRTFVVDGDGGWERRAYVAVESALDVAFAELAPGVTAASVHAEAAAELAAYGFPAAEEGEAGFTHGTGHGVGVSLHEAPGLTGDTELQPGHVVTIEPGVYDPDRGGVRLEDLVVITDGGAERLATYPRSIVPSTDRFLD
nr:Xaa-Pro peptidase family protein [Halalkalirubrum salinum]